MNNQKNKNILSKSISSLFIIIFIILFIFLFTGYPYSIIYITIFCIGFLPLSIIYYVTIKIINKKKNRLEPNLIENQENKEIHNTDITTKILGIFIILTTLIGLIFYLMNYAGEKRIREDDQRFQLKAEKDSQIIKQYYEKYITLFSSPKNISSLSLYQEDAYNGFLLWFEFSFSNTDVKVRNNIWIASNCSTETIQKIENKIQKEYIGKSVMIKLPDSEYEFEKYVTTHRTINDSGYLGLDTELTRIKADIYMDDSLINNNINKIVTSTTN